MTIPFKQDDTRDGEQQQVLYDPTTRQELHYLATHFRLAQQKETREHPLSVHGQSLTDPVFVQQYLQSLQQALKASSLAATASYFSKRYSYLLAVNGLYALTFYDKGLKLTQENVYIHSHFEQEMWLPKLFLTDSQSSVPHAGERAEWRDTVVKELFQHFSKVWACLEQVAHLSVKTLWENTAIYVYWLYESQLEKAESETLSSKLKADFHYLTHQAPPHFFGTLGQNALAFFHHDKRAIPELDKNVSVRLTCCLYHQVNSEGTLCTTCPNRYKKKHLPCPLKG